MFRFHVETCHALPQSEATEAAVLHAVFEMASREELSFFDEVLFQLSGSVGDANIFGGRIQQGPEFSRFRYDIGLAVKGNVTHGSCSKLCKVLGTSAETTIADFVDPKLVNLLPLLQVSACNVDRRSWGLTFCLVVK